MTSKNPMWRQRCGACDAVVAGAVVIDGDEDALEIAARFLAALGLTADNLRPLPPPIKVGQTVKRCASRDDHLSYEVVAITDGKRVHLWNEETTTPAWDWVHGVRRVDSSPSPEPEREDEPYQHPDTGDGLELAWGLIANAWEGRWDDAPADWREAAERWRDEVWHPYLDDLVSPTADPAPSPSPEVGEGVEPHESDDPEELAAAVAAGLRVNPRPPGADWRDRQTYDSTVSAFRDALDYGFRYRIHGTVPGYGETGGAS